MTNTLFKYPNVVGYGMGKQEDGQETVTVLVSRKLPLAALASSDAIPGLAYSNTIGAEIPTDVIEVGHLRALQFNRLGRHRPAPGGVSIGHYKISAGTLGSVVRDAGTEQRLILSNNHVLANSNDAEIGDVILQPGPADGGKLGFGDAIGTLLRFTPIVFGQSGSTCPTAERVARVLNAAARGIRSEHRLEAVKVKPQAVNTIDAAVAQPIGDGAVSDEIHDIGKIQGTAEVGIGDTITKSGRTTGITTDKVLVLDATVKVDYGSAGSATFDKQIIGGPMSAGGDSGSIGVIFVDGEAYAFGLLFGGSELVTIFNPIEDVLQNLSIRF